MSKNTGGSAFPQEKVYVTGGQHHQSLGMQGGMTLRDYFAAKAMQGMCAHPDTWGLNGYSLAEEAYAIADAMLEAREK